MNTPQIIAGSEISIVDGSVEDTPSVTDIHLGTGLNGAIDFDTYSSNIECFFVSILLDTEQGDNIHSTDGFHTETSCTGPRLNPFTGQQILFWAQSYPHSRTASMLAKNATAPEKVLVLQIARRRHFRFFRAHLHPTSNKVPYNLNAPNQYIRSNAFLHFHKKQAALCLCVLPRHVLIVDYSPENSNSP